MKPNKKTARIVGILFLLATATYMTGSMLIDTLVKSPDYLTNVYPNRIQIISGVLLQFVDAVVVVGIGVVMYPLLKRYNETIAVGYVATRILEFVLLVFGGIGSLLLITLSGSMLEAGAVNVDHFQAVGALLQTQIFLGYQIAMLTLGLGSMLFCYLLYTSRLIPQWMSALGLIGYFGLAVGAVLELFGIELGLMFSIPGGLFELILPVWLMIKGFDSSSIVSKSVNTGPVKIEPAKTVIHTSDASGVAQAYTALGETTR